MDLRRARISRIRGADRRARPQPKGGGAIEADAVHVDSYLLWGSSAKGRAMRPQETVHPLSRPRLADLTPSPPECSRPTRSSPGRMLLSDTAPVPAPDMVSLLRARVLDPRTAALLWLLIDGGVPLVVAGPTADRQRTELAEALLSIDPRRSWVLLDATNDAISTERLAGSLRGSASLGITVGAGRLEEQTTVGALARFAAGRH